MITDHYLAETWKPDSFSDTRPSAHTSQNLRRSLPSIYSTFNERQKRLTEKATPAAIMLHDDPSSFIRAGTRGFVFCASAES